MREPKNQRENEKKKKYPIYTTEVRVPILQTQTPELKPSRRARERETEESVD